VETLAGLAAVLVPFAIWAIKRRADQSDKQAPDRQQEEMDH